MKKEYTFFILTIVLFFVLFLISEFFDIPETAKVSISRKETTEGNFKGENIKENNISQFFNLNLDAKAVYIYDLKNSREIFAKNAEIQLPLASLAKLMTAVIGRENLNSDTVVIISKEALEQEGDNGFLINEKWSLKDLTDIMLVSSSNDAAFAMTQTYADNNADLRGNMIEMMNKKAKELKMAQTFFLNSTGLDFNSAANGGYGSARDIVILLKYILKNHPQILFKTGQETLNIVSLDGKIRAFQNTNQNINKISQFIGGKTGFTDLAGGNLAVVFDVGVNHPVAAVVLNSSFKGRFEDMEKLAEASYQVMGMRFPY